MHSFIKGFLCLWLALGAAGAWAVEVPNAENLRKDALQLREQGTPLLLMFYADDCAYCVRMEEEFLEPMLVSGAYDAKVVMRRVRLDSGFSLKDFDGRAISGAELAQRYKVFVTPTLVFLDANGHQLAEKMVGLSTPDFFGSYLDAAIDTALVHMRGGRGASTVAGRIDPNCNPLC